MSSDGDLPLLRLSLVKGKQIKHSLGDCEARWWYSPSFSSSIVPSSFPDPSFPILLKCRFGFRGSRLGEWGKAEIDAFFSNKGVTDPFHPALYFGAVLIPWITWGSLNTMDSQSTHQTDWIRVTGAEARQVFREKKKKLLKWFGNKSVTFVFLLVGEKGDNDSFENLTVGIRLRCLKTNYLTSQGLPVWSKLPEKARPPRPAKGIDQFLIVPRLA